MWLDGNDATRHNGASNVCNVVVPGVAWFGREVCKPALHWEDSFAMLTCTVLAIATYGRMSKFR